MSSVDRLPKDERELWNKAIAALGEWGCVQILAPGPDPDYSEFKSDVIILRNADRTYGVYDIASDTCSEPTDEDRTESELEELAAERGDDDEWEV